jgi:hypothetical protein
LAACASSSTGGAKTPILRVDDLGSTTKRAVRRKGSLIAVGARVRNRYLTTRR